jgi:hypothetical protein
MKNLIFILIAVSLATSAQAQLTNQERMLGQGGTYEAHSTDSIVKDFFAFELSADAEVDALTAVRKTFIGTSDTIDLRALMFENDSALMGGTYFIPKKYKGTMIKLGSGKVKLFIEE